MQKLLYSIFILLIIGALYVSLMKKHAPVPQEVPGRVRVQTWDPEHRFNIQVKNEYRDLA